MGDPEEDIRLSVDRSPLVELESGVEGFFIDCDTYNHIPAMHERYLEHCTNAIQDPDRILGGLERENFHEAICYAKRQWESSHVLLVFAKLDTDLKSIFVTEWALRYEDEASKGCPAGWEKDFGGILWPQR